MFLRMSQRRDTIRNDEQFRLGTEETRVSDGVRPEPRRMRESLSYAFFLSLSRL